MAGTPTTIDATPAVTNRSPCSLPALAPSRQFCGLLNLHPDRAGANGETDALRRPWHDDGTNPAADAPDGKSSNLKSTTATRAADKTLGTKINGTNPGNKFKDAVDAMDWERPASPFPAFRT